MKISAEAPVADRHAVEVNHLLYHKEKLYSACADGKIKLWTPELKKMAEVQAHKDSVFCLAASEDTLFSCGKKGNIKAWELSSLREKKVLGIDEQQFFFKIHFLTGCLFYGEDKNNIKVFENLETGEKQDDYTPCTMIFTVKDEDVVVTDVKTSGTRLLWGDKKTFMGKEPVTLIGSRRFAFVSRDSRSILIHENNYLDHFAQLYEIENAHAKDIKALAGDVWDNKELLFSGGEDQIVRKWELDKKGKATKGNECNVGMAVLTIIPGQKGELYVSGKGGHIAKMTNV